MNPYNTQHKPQGTYSEAPLHRDKADIEIREEENKPIPKMPAHNPMTPDKLCRLASNTHPAATKRPLIISFSRVAPSMTAH